MIKWRKYCLVIIMIVTKISNLNLFTTQGHEFRPRSKRRACEAETAMVLLIGLQLEKILDQHHFTKLKLKLYLCQSNSCQKIFQNIVTWGVEFQWRKTIFMCFPMERLFSGVRPNVEHRLYVECYSIHIQIPPTATQVSYNTVPLWFLQARVPLRVLCSYSTMQSSSYNSSPRIPQRTLKGTPTCSYHSGTVILITPYVVSGRNLDRGCINFVLEICDKIKYLNQNFKLVQWSYHQACAFAISKSQPTYITGYNSLTKHIYILRIINLLIILGKWQYCFRSTSPSVYNTACPTENGPLKIAHKYGAS